MSPRSSTVTIPLEIDCTTAEKVASSVESLFSRSRSSTRAPRNCSARKAARAPDSRNADRLRTTLRSSRPEGIGGRNRYAAAGGRNPISMPTVSPEKAREAPMAPMTAPRAGLSGTFPNAIPLLDRTGDGEDRQVHGDEEAADDAAEEHHHHRLDHAGESAHRGVDLVVVEVGDLGEHLVHRSRRLADA